MISRIIHSVAITIGGLLHWFEPNEQKPIGRRQPRPCLTLTLLLGRSSSSSYINIDIVCFRFEFEPLTWRRMPEKSARFMPSTIERITNHSSVTRLQSNWWFFVWISTLNYTRHSLWRCSTFASQWMCSSIESFRFCLRFGSAESIPRQDKWKTLVRCLVNTMLGMSIEAMQLELCGVECGLEWLESKFASQPNSPHTRVIHQSHSVDPQAGCSFEREKPLCNFNHTARHLCQLSSSASAAMSIV